MKMGSSEFGTGKSIVVLAIVVGCFAILWPKIFYPMMQAAFAMTSPGENEPRPFRPRDRPPHRQPGTVAAPAPRDIPQDGTFIKEGRPFPHPSSRQPVKPQSKSGGAMGIVMPIYTIGIVVFFLYTVLKLVFKKNPEEEEQEKKPLIKDFHMDPDYHKFVCEQPPNTNVKRPSEPIIKTKERKKTAVIDEQNATVDDKDYEIYKLRKKLEETESAMQRIMKHMGAVSDCLNNACMQEAANAAAAKKQANEQQATKPILRLNKKKKPSFKLDDVEKIDKNDVAESIDKELQQDNADATDQEIKQQLKRDSSINSETSSFELLSQGMSVDSSNEEIDEEEVDDSKNDDGSNDDAGEEVNQSNEEEEEDDESCEDEEEEEIEDDDVDVAGKKSEQSVKS